MAGDPVLSKLGSTAVCLTHGIMPLRSNDNLAGYLVTLLPLHQGTAGVDRRRVAAGRRLRSVAYAKLRDVLRPLKGGITRYWAQSWALEFLYLLARSVITEWSCWGPVNRRAPPCCGRRNRCRSAGGMPIQMYEPLSARSAARFTHAVAPIVSSWGTNSLIMKLSHTFQA